ncbi:MAG: hypothetical protein N2C14_17485, partial [Planctomycetales bacterium]
MKLSMAVSEATSLTAAELKQTVQGIEPRAFLVSSRVLRRVIRKERHKHEQVPGSRLWVPHRKCYVLGREALLRHVDLDELDFAKADLAPEVDQASASAALAPEWAILLVEPDSDRLAEEPADRTLWKTWRLLFHCRVHLAMEHGANGRLTEQAAEQAIQQIGPGILDEAFTVLQEERLLLPPRDASTALVEFAAVYLELRRFAERLVKHYFPSVNDHERVEEILASFVNADELFEATRLPGSMDPKLTTSRQREDEKIDQETKEVVKALETRDAKQFPRLVERAEKAEFLDNSARSAILYLRAAHVETGTQADDAKRKSQAALDKLLERLDAALKIPERDRDEWREALEALLRQSVRDRWTAEGRLLYDLQRACLAREREIHTVDVVEWALWLGRRPLKRPLPLQEEVLVCRRLDRAVTLLADVRLKTDLAERFSRLLRAARHQAQQNLRDRFRPLARKALDQVGLNPANVPERVSRDKVVEDLLDVAAQRGFLTLGNLRDVIASNNLKLPDLGHSRAVQPPERPSPESAAGAAAYWFLLLIYVLRRLFHKVWEFLRGDQLLRLDLAMAVELDGVHRR